MGSSAPYKIHYFRPPDNEVVFDAQLLYEDSEVIVTSLTLSRVSAPLVISGETVIDNGYRAVFAEYRNQWHDVAKVFSPTGEFTGYYADINTPSEDREDGYWTKDLYLDIWIPADKSSAIVLDEDEFAEAVSNNWITSTEAETARNELARLLALFEAGQFPPEILARFS